jgi:hypothetical protein
MNKSRFLPIFYDVLIIIFIPFLIVLFIEFVLRFGMGPFVERISFFPAIYVSALAVCSFTWIRKKIIFAVFPMLIFASAFGFLMGNGNSAALTILYYFLSFFILSFFSVIGYSFSKVINTYGKSQVRYIIQFFTVLVIFICGMFLVQIVAYFFNPIPIISKFLLEGLRKGFLMGCGVSVAILFMSQRRD